MTNMDKIKEHSVEKRAEEGTIVEINGKKYEVSYFNHGNCRGTIYKPIRTPEEEEKARKRLYDATANFFKEVERQRKEKAAEKEKEAAGIK